MSRREEIVAAATKVFAEKGFNKATMDDVAMECGVSKGTLYLYFSSKNALIGALYAHELTLYLNAIREAASYEGTPPEKLRMFIAFIERTFQEQDALVKLVPELTTYIMQNPGLIEMDKTAAIETRHVLSGIIKEGIREGYFRPLDPEVAATTIIGAASGVLLQVYFDPEQSLKLSLDYLSDFIVKGVSGEHHSNP